MTLLIVKEGLRQNGILFALLAGVLLALGLLAGRGTASESTNDTGASKAFTHRLAVKEAPAGSRDRASAQDVALATIAQHQEQLDLNPRSPEAPALLMAMGNLYRQKMSDYAKSAQCYEILLHDHATWQGKRAAYFQLITCYEQLDDRANLRRVYNEMTETFPADSQEFLFAKEQLTH